MITNYYTPEQLKLRKQFKLNQIKQAFDYALGQRVFKHYKDMPYLDRQNNFDFVGNWKYKNTKIKKNGTKSYTFENIYFVNLKKINLTIDS